MSKYKKRIADALLERKLAGKGAVLIEGPKWCGKTTTAEQHAKSILYMDDPKKIKENLVTAVNSNAKVYQIVIQKYTTFEAAKIQKAGYTL